MSRQKLPSRVKGPYYLSARNKWRIRIVDAGRVEDIFFDSEIDARQAMARAAKKLTEVSHILGDLLKAWVVDKERHSNAKSQTCADHLAALERFFGRYLTDDLGKITPRRAEAIYSGVVIRPNERTGKPLAVATHQMHRSLAHGFFLWATRKGYVSESPFRNVRPVGRVSTGKAQLTLDEAKRYRDTALGLFDGHKDIMALAAAVPLYLGLRSSEVLSRRVRDLDCNGTMLRIDRGKTCNARRYLAIKAPALRVRLMRLAANRRPEELLFAMDDGAKPHDRGTLWRTVHRVCKAADLPIVCPHSLRGLWATLGVESGAAESAVATALGHSSFEMTARHYAQPEAMTDARSNRVARFLESEGTDDATVMLPADELIARLPTRTLEQLRRLLDGGLAISVVDHNSSENR